jgi:hypothetical protein
MFRTVAPRGQSGGGRRPSAARAYPYEVPVFGFVVARSVDATVRSGASECADCSVSGGVFEC